MIEFRTLGPIDLRAANGVSVLSIISQPKRLALLSYLACPAPGTPHRRDRILSVFWEDLEQTAARSNLRRSLHFLRRSLGPGVIESQGDAVVVSDEHLWLDVAAFGRALSDEDHRSALDLYRGDFLDGLHTSDSPGVERWIDAQRARLRRRAVTAAGTIVVSLEAARSYEEALRWARRALELSPYDEAHFRRIVILLGRLGRPAEIRPAYERFATRLESDIRTAPSPETVATVERTCRADTPSASRAPRGPPSAAETVPDAGPGGPAPSARGITEHSSTGAPNPGGRVRRAATVLVPAAIALVSLPLIEGLRTDGDSTGGDREVPRRTRLTTAGDVRVSSMSTDGQFLAYAAGETGDMRLMVLDLRSRSTVEVTRSAHIPSVEWSPDGGFLLWTARDEEDGYRGWVIPRLSGDPRSLPIGPRATWDPTGRRVLSWWMARRAVYVTDVETGETARIPLSDDAHLVSSADWAPRSERALVVTQSADSEFSITLVDLADGRLTPLRQHDTHHLQSPRWSADERAAYFFRDGELWRVWTEPPRRGEAAPVEGGMQPPVGDAANVLTISADGRDIVYTAAIQYSNIWAVRFGGDGGLATATRLTDGTGQLLLAGIAPDGSRWVTLESDAGGSDVRERSLSGDAVRRLTFGRGVSAAALAPRGDRLALLEGRPGGDVLRILELTGGAGITWGPVPADPTSPALAWLGRNEVLVRRTDGLDWIRIHLDGGPEPVAFIGEPEGVIINPVASPEARWVAAYWSRDARFPPGGPGLWLISPDGAERRRLGTGFLFPIGWSPDGGRLYYVDRSEGVLFVYSLAGGTRARLGSFPFSPGRCLLIPGSDERGFLCEDRATVSDVWRVDNFDPSSR